jgi:hypothetical protein
MRHLPEIVQGHYESFAIWPRAPKFEDDTTKNNLAYSEEPPVYERAHPEAQNENPSFSLFCCVPVRTNKSRRKCLLGYGQEALRDNENSIVHQF